MRIQNDRPRDLRGDSNDRILAYLRGKSAHSDIVFPLESAARTLPNVELYCSDRKDFGYVFAYTGQIIFGFAVGMGGVCLRLPPALASAAIRAGAVATPEPGPDWIYFKLFGIGGFESGINYWVGEAYKLAVTPPENPSNPDPLRGSA